MPIITLTTDYGNKDYFAAALKGNILKQNSSAHIVDVTHQINPFQIGEAAYILSNAYKHFPKGSIHIIDIDS
ncbi:MAG: SAM-dependent chlorinase/fluorinase, partial [Bacteroidia bacterium]